MKNPSLGRGRDEQGRFVKGDSADPLIRIQDRFLIGDDCWEWIGAIGNHGYGAFSLDGKQITAHRAVYQLFVGPIPPGYHIDHLCRNRACVRPDHLEAVTQGENNARATAIRTHCHHGHPLDGWSKTRHHRYCKTCKRIDANRYYHTVVKGQVA